MDHSTHCQLVLSWKPIELNKDEEEDSDYHWDKDSFDGLEYHSSDDYSNDENDKEEEKRSRCYHRTIIESKGFYDQYDGFPNAMWGGIGRVKNLDDEIEEGVTIRQFLINLATECVKKYNQRKNKNVRFHEFVRANFHAGGFSKYYITFLARESDSPNAPLVEYQAKVGRCGGKTYPILCRPSSPL